MSDGLVEKLNNLREEVGILSEDNEKLKDLKDRVIVEKMRSMRDNLILTGLGEKGLDENVVSLIRSIIRDRLSIDSEISFERVHRMGPFRRDRRRPIVAKFSSHQKKEHVRNKRLQTCRQPDRHSRTIPQGNQRKAKVSSTSPKARESARWKKLMRC